MNQNKKPKTIDSIIEKLEKMKKEGWTLIGNRYMEYIPNFASEMTIRFHKNLKK